MYLNIDERGRERGGEGGGGGAGELTEFSLTDPEFHRNSSMSDQE